MKCKYCGRATETEFCSPGHRNRYRLEYSKQTPRSKAIEAEGGECSRCGWNEHEAGLLLQLADGTEYDFVHPKPWHIIEYELADATLVCTNCDAVLNAGG